MKVFGSAELEDGSDYFCVHKGIVYYLTVRLAEDMKDFFIFFYEDIHGGIEGRFDAWECDLTYKL